MHIASMKITIGIIEFYNGIVNGFKGLYLNKPSELLNPPSLKILHAALIGCLRNDAPLSLNKTMPCLYSAWHRSQQKLHSTCLRRAKLQLHARNKRRRAPKIIMDFALIISHLLGIVNVGW